MTRPKLDRPQRTLDRMVSRTLDVVEPLHGYGIAPRVGRLSGDEVLLHQGTIYASLVRVPAARDRRRGGVSDSHRKAKFYAITRPAGGR